MVTGANWSTDVPAAQSMRDVHAVPGNRESFMSRNGGRQDGGHRHLSTRARITCSVHKARPNREEAPFRGAGLGRYRLQPARGAYSAVLNERLNYQEQFVDHVAQINNQITSKWYCAVIPSRQDVGNAQEDCEGEGG
jgi:hypothetical protein